MLIDRENKTALVTDTEVLLTHNLFNTEAEKLTKYENLAVGMKYVWKLHSVCTSSLGISAEGVVTQNFPKYLGNIGCTNNMLRVGQEEVLLETCHSKQIHRTYCLNLGHRMIFLLLTGPNTTSYVG